MRGTCHWNSILKHACYKLPIQLSLIDWSLVVGLNVSNLSN